MRSTLSKKEFLQALKTIELMNSIQHKGTHNPYNQSYYIDLLRNPERMRCEYGLYDQTYTHITNLINTLLGPNIRKVTPKLKSGYVRRSIVKYIYSELGVKKEKKPPTPKQMYYTKGRR